jgi:hypothetical protein
MAMDSMFPIQVDIKSRKKLGNGRTQVVVAHFSHESRSMKLENPSVVIEVPDSHPMLTLENYQVSLGQDARTGNIIWEQKQRERTTYEISESDLLGLLSDLTARINALESK